MANLSISINSTVKETLRAHTQNSGISQSRLVEAAVVEVLLRPKADWLLLIEEAPEKIERIIAQSQSLP